MNTLARLKGFWAKMDSALGSLTDAINLRTPQQGDGISINENPNGFIISLRSTPDAPLPATDSTGLTADQKALLKALASDPGIGGATNHEGAPINFIPWKKGKTAGWRKITFLSDGVLNDDWVWSGTPFNPRACDPGSFVGEA